MIARPALSIVIPVFNRERLLAQALESVLPQLQDGDEIIVADDGSSDGSVATARRYPQVVVEASPANHGAAAALNRGLARASRAWLAFLDSDDLAAPDRFARQAADLRSADAPEVVFGAQWRFAGEERPPPPEPLPAAQIEDGPTIGTMLLRRATFLRVGPLDETLRNGYFTAWYARAVALGLRLRQHRTVVLWRRAHAGAHLSQTHHADHARALKQILDARRRAAHGTPPAA